MFNKTHIIFDSPEIVFETRNSPQGYMGASAKVIFTDRNDLADLLARAGFIDENTKDAGEVIDYYATYGEFEAISYVPDSDHYHEAFTKLVLKYPDHVNDYDGSIEWETKEIRIDGGETRFIRDEISKSMSCPDIIAFAHKVRDTVHEDLNNDFDYFKPASVYQVSSQGLGSNTYLYCDFYLYKDEMCKLLVKTDYLKDCSEYYESRVSTISTYESLDKNIRFQFGANLYEDGTGELVIRQYDIKMRHEWEKINDSFASAEHMPLFLKNIKTYPLEKESISAIKDAINMYLMREGLSVRAESLLETIAKANERERQKELDGPINENIKMDMPYIVRNGANSYIEAPLSFTDKEFDVLLKRQPLKYEEGTEIHKTSELRPDTWVTAYAQITKDDGAAIELQIDGVNETQGQPKFLVLTEKEVGNLLCAAEKRCKECNTTLNYLKSHINKKSELKEK